MSRIGECCCCVLWWWVDGSFACCWVAWAECRAAGFHCVVFGTEPAEVPERGGAVFGVVDFGVVDFEVAAGMAVFDIAFASTDEERSFEFCVDVSAEVRDGGDVFAFGDDGGEERVAEDLFDVIDADGPDTGDLAAFARYDIAADECGVVDDDMNIDFCSCLL